MVLSTGFVHYFICTPYLAPTHQSHSLVCAVCISCAQRHFPRSGGFQLVVVCSGLTDLRCTDGEGFVHMHRCYCHVVCTLLTCFVRVLYIISIWWLWFVHGFCLCRITTLQCAEEVFLLQKEEPIYGRHLSKLSWVPCPPRGLQGSTGRRWSTVLLLCTRMTASLYSHAVTPGEVHLTPSFSPFCSKNHLWREREQSSYWQRVPWGLTILWTSLCITFVQEPLCADQVAWHEWSLPLRTGS